MNYENTTQELALSIDPAQLCEQCPFASKFAPQNSEGTGQETAQEKALGTSGRTQEIDLQMPLSFEGEWMHLETSESIEPKPADEIIHRLALAYLMHDASRSRDDEQIATDPAHIDESDIKAELDRLERQTEAEEAHSGDATAVPDKDGEAALVHSAKDRSENRPASIQAGRVAKSTSHHRSEEQKGTDQRDSQRPARVPFRESSKDQQTTGRDRS